MRHALPALLIAAAGAAQAAGIVDVSFNPGPSRYSDAGATLADDARTEQALRTYFQGWAARLPDGQTLHLEVKDIDLAGTIRYKRGTPVRVLRGSADWPRITLAYKLEAGGSVLRSGQETVKDMNYLMAPPDYRTGDSLEHEKRMLDDWFAHRFGAAGAP